MHPDARTRLRAAIERKNAERGRPLTACEKLENLAAWLAEDAAVNPFQSNWYRAAELFQPIFRVLGFTLCLKRCSWTKCGARLALAWIGYGQ